MPKTNVSESYKNCYIGSFAWVSEWDLTVFRGTSIPAFRACASLPRTTGGNAECDGGSDRHGHTAQLASLGDCCRLLDFTRYAVHACACEKLARKGTVYRGRRSNLHSSFSTFPQGSYKLARECPLQ